MRSVSVAGRVAAVAAVAAAIVIVAIVLFGGGGGYQVKARFQNAGQLVKGNQVEIGGVPAGTVDDIAITDAGQAEVSMTVDDQYTPLPVGTQAVIRQASLSGIANRYVDLQLPPGSHHGGRERTIANGGTIPITATTTSVDLDQLFNTLDPPTRSAIKAFFRNSAVQYVGKTKQQREAFRYLNPALSTSSRLFSELNRDSPLLSHFLQDSSTLVTALAEKRNELTALISNANTTFRALGSQRLALEEAIARLPDFMRQANTTFVNLRAALNDVDPLVNASKPVAIRLRPFLAQLRPLARDIRPTIRDLAQVVLQPGPNNDLLNLEQSFPPLASAALDTKKRKIDFGTGPMSVGTVQGSFPITEKALHKSTPLIAQGRPYTRPVRLVRRLLHDRPRRRRGRLLARERGLQRVRPLGLHADADPAGQPRPQPELRAGPARPVQALPRRFRGAGGRRIERVQRSAAEQARLQGVGTSDGADPMIRRLSTALVLVGAVIAAVALTGAGGDGTGKKFKIAFDNAFGLTQGGDLRVGGVKAGATQAFKLSKGPECQNPGSPGPPRTCAIVEAEITEPGFRSFRSDASCAIRQQSLIGEYYVDCQPGNTLTVLKSGSTIPVVRNQSTIAPDLVGNVLRRPYRERLRIILAELGTGLAGRPTDLAEVLRRAHPGLQQTRKVLKILGDQSKIIQDFIKNSDTVVAQLDQKKNEVARWITETGRTAAISAGVRDSIAAGFHKLPTFLGELKPTMQKLGALTDQQTPLLADLQRAAPSLTEFLTRLGPFSDASRPAFRSLAAAGDAGRRAFIDSKEEIAALNSLAKNAPKLGKPLRQLLQTADDRHRAVDGDTRAAATAPPAPDRNSNSPTPRRGFTAMESLLNYFFWQTLALNEFDDISHMLRVAGYVIPDCSNVQNDLRGPSMGGTAQQEAIRHKCASSTRVRTSLASPPPTRRRP